MSFLLPATCFTVSYPALDSNPNEKAIRRNRFFILCSHQESNLDRRYRKPVFYPLNYESKYYGVTVFAATCARLYLKNQKNPVLDGRMVLLNALRVNVPQPRLQSHQRTPQELV